MFDTSHHIDLSIATESFETLKLAEDDHPVFPDLIDCAELDIRETPDGMKTMYDLDVIVSTEGMEAIENLSEGDGDLGSLCEALIEVAEPTDGGVMVGELSAEGESRKLHAFQNGFDPMEETGEIEDPEAFADANPIEGLVEDLRNPDSS